MKKLLTFKSLLHKFEHKALRFMKKMFYLCHIKLGVLVLPHSSVSSLVLSGPVSATNQSRGPQTCSWQETALHLCLHLRERGTFIGSILCSMNSTLKMLFLLALFWKFVWNLHYIWIKTWPMIELINPHCTRNIILQFLWCSMLKKHSWRALTGYAKRKVIQLLKQVKMV